MKCTMRKVCQRWGVFINNSRIVTFAEVYLVLPHGVQEPLTIYFFPGRF